MLVWILGFSVLGSIAAIAFASTYLIFAKKIRPTLILCLISYATGTLLGAAFLGLLRHALDSAPAASILPTVLAGLLVFFCLKSLSFGGIATTRIVRYTLQPALYF